MRGDPSKDVGKPGLRVDVVHLRRYDQAVHGGGSLSTAVRAAEHPRFSSQSNAAQGALGRVVRQAHPPVVQEQREGGPTLEDVIDG